MLEETIEFIKEFECLIYRFTDMYKDVAKKLSDVTNDVDAGAEPSKLYAFWNRASGLVEGYNGEIKEFNGQLEDYFNKAKEHIDHVFAAPDSEREPDEKYLRLLFDKIKLLKDQIVRIREQSLGLIWADGRLGKAFSVLSDELAETEKIINDAVIYFD